MTYLLSVLLMDNSLMTAYEEQEDDAWHPSRSSNFIRSLSLIICSYLITCCLSVFLTEFSFKFLTVSIDDSSISFWPSNYSNFS